MCGCKLGDGVRRDVYESVDARAIVLREGFSDFEIEGRDGGIGDVDVV
jgi:hypothetical protein